MKKALIGITVFWFVLILAGLTLSPADNRKRSTCDKLATWSSVDEPNTIVQKKSYALRFPVR
jgi:hypothetical protein